MILQNILKNKVNIILLLAFVVLLVLYIAVSLFRYKAKQKKQKITKTVDYGSGHKDYLILLTRIYETTIGLRTLYDKVKKKVAIIYPADSLVIQKKATKIMTRSLLIGMCIISCVIILNIKFGWDMVYVVTGIAMTYVLFTEFMEQSYEKLDKTLLEQFGDFLSDVRHNYHNTPMADLSVYNTIDHLPVEMALHAERFYEVFTSTNVESAAGNYADISPNRFFTTFVAIGASAMEYGDEKENSTFLLNLNYLKEEVDIELNKREENDYKFSGLIFVTLFPVFLLKLVEIWMKHIIPELGSWYQGLAGSVITICMIPVTVICYQMIKSLKNRKQETKREHKLLEAISKIPIISMLLNKEINNHYTKNQRIGDSLKLVGDTETPKQFLVKRCIWCVATVITINLLFCVSDIRERITLLNDFTTSYQTSIVPSAEYREDMKSLTKDYVNLYKHEKEIDADVLTQNIINTTQITNPTYAKMMAETIIKRVTEYRNVYYKYYFLLISILGGVVGYYMPLWMLTYKKRILSHAMADEVNQFQTIMLILMNEDGITMDTVLEWMERFSYCFKASIEECIMTLERGVQEALADMKAKETFPPFRRFCDKLMSIDSVGLKEAFDEITIDRAYYIQKRQLDNKKLMDNKSAIAKMICFVPLLYLIFLQLLLPFLTYANNMLQIMNSMY